MSLISHDSPFMRFMDRLADVFLVNIMWVLGSLPLLTLGASTAAALRVFMEMETQREKAPVWPSFWRAWAENLGGGSLAWLVQALAIYVLWIYGQILSVVGGEDPFVVVFFIATAVFMLPLFLYLQPQVAWYHNHPVLTLTNAYALALRFPLRTLLLGGLIALEGALFVWNPLMVFLGLMVGPGIILYTIAAMSVSLFTIIDQRRSPPQASD